MLLLPHFLGPTLVHVIGPPLAAAEPLWPDKMGSQPRAPPRTVPHIGLFFLRLILFFWIWSWIGTGRWSWEDVLALAALQFPKSRRRRIAPLILAVLVQSHSTHARPPYTTASHRQLAAATTKNVISFAISFTGWRWQCEEGAGGWRGRRERKEKNGCNF